MALVNSYCRTQATLVGTIWFVI